MEEPEKQLLKEYGLKDNEIKIILILARNKELTAYKIAKITRIHRSTTYDLLEKLIEKGFVTKKEIKKHFLFELNDISAIMSRVKDKENILLSLIPLFEEIKKDKKELIKVYQNVSGQKEFLNRLFYLADKKIVKNHYLLGNTPASTISSNVFLEMVIEKFKESGSYNKIDYKGIWDVKFKKKQVLKSFNQLGKNKFLRKLPSKVTTMIYGDYIAFAYTTNNPTIIEIKNSLIANEIKSYFNFLWELAEE